MEHLSKNYCVINVDLPRRGNSDWNSDIHNINDSAKAIVRDLPKTASYIGWSFGGLVTLAIAALYPQRVRQITGITTTPKFIAREGWLALPQPGFKPAGHKANANLSVLLKLTDICDATDLRTKIKSLRCPVDLIWGGQDGSVPAIMFEKIKALNPRVATHIIPKAQHIPFWTHSVEFNKIR